MVSRGWSFLPAGGSHSHAYRPVGLLLLLGDDGDEDAANNDLQPVQADNNVLQALVDGQEENGDPQPMKGELAVNFDLHVEGVLPPQRGEHAVNGDLLPKYKGHEEEKGSDTNAMGSVPTQTGTDSAAAAEAGYGPADDRLGTNPVAADANGPDPAPETGFRQGLRPCSKTTSDPGNAADGYDVDLDEDAAADYCDVAESANYDGVADLMQLADEYTSVDEGACEEHAAEDAFAAHAAEFFEDDEFAEDAVSADPHEDRTKSTDPDEDAESDADLSADDARDEDGVADEGISDAAADAYASLADAEAHVADADGSDASDNDDEDEDASADGISDEGTTAGADSADNDYDGDSADDASDGADADDTEFDDDAELAGNADPASSSDDGSVDEISNVNDMADEAVDAIEYVDVQAYEEDSSVDCVPADEDFYAGADAYRDVVGDPQKIVEAANTLLHAAIDDLIAAKDGDDLQPISANIVDGGPTAGDFPVESLFTPLWGSKDGQAREKFLYDAVKTMKPKARVKMKAELQIFYLTKCLLDPGI